MAESVLEAKFHPPGGDEDEQTSLCRAFTRFSQDLDPKERNDFAKVTILDLLLNARDWDASHASSSTSRSVANRINPFLLFVHRHAKAVDTMVQCYPNPSALIWGMMRVVLESARSFASYYREMISMIEQLSDSFSRYQEYEILMCGNQRFHEALTNIYYNILIFLKKAKQVFTTRDSLNPRHFSLHRVKGHCAGFKTLCKNIWRGFEADFQDALEALARHKKSLDAEIMLVHQIDTHRLYDRQLKEQQKTQDCLYRIEEVLHIKRSIMKWLSPMDMEAVLIRVSKCRTSSSGGWLLRHDDIQAWLESQDRAIWVSGPVGSGKTVLSATIVDDLKKRTEKNPKRMLAFFFCDKVDEDSQSVFRIFATIIAQLLAQMHETPGHVRDAYSAASCCGRSRVSTSDQPMRILRDLSSLLDSLHIVVDGLDESKEAATIVESIQGLIENTTNIHVILFSREIPALTHRKQDFRSIMLTPDLVGPDVDEFFSRELTELPTEDSKLLGNVFQMLSRAACGSFLWSSFMIKNLKSATSPQEMMEMISDTPIGLDETYAAILTKIVRETPRRRKLMRNILLSICCSARPLKWAELQSMLSFEISDTSFVESRKPFKSAVLELGGSLFEYSPTNDQFRLIHSSVREFLLSSFLDMKIDENTREFIIKVDEGQSELAEICLIYQSRHICNTSTSLHSETDPLLEYSTLYWCHHVCQAKYSLEIEERIANLLAVASRRQTWILRFLKWQSSTFPLQYLLKLQKALYEWLAQGQKTFWSDDLLDWIQDIPETLVGDTSINFKDQNSNSDGDAKLLKRVQPTTSHFEKLMVIRDLSREYTLRGALANGERWLTNALGIQRRRYGYTHISTAWLLNSLGLIYDQQQRALLSSQTQEFALTMQTAELGPNHLETIWTVNELGRIYRHLNELNKAESMHQQALAVLRGVLPPQDLQIAWTLNTLGRTYRRQHRFDEAIALHDEALNIQRVMLGEIHPHTIWASMDKAACRLEQGHCQKSENLYREALEARERVLGWKHGDTLWAVNNLGRVLEEMGRIEEAKSLQERAFHGQVEILGSGHPHTLWSKDIIEKLNVRI